MRVENSIYPTENLRLKAFFERSLDVETISLATWYRIKEAMKQNDLNIEKEDLKLVASIKKSFKGSNIPLAELIRGYLESTIHLRKSNGFRGDVVFLELKSITGHNCANTTITRWFKNIKADENGHKFSAERIYKAVELYPIYLRAYSYKSKYSNRRKKAA